MNALPGFDRWLERPYTDAVDAQMADEAACEEFWDEEAAKFVAENWNDILDMVGWQDLLTRIGRLCHGTRDDSIARAWGHEVESIVRAFCLKHEDEINARCCKRAEDQRQELIADMRAARYEE